MKTKSKVLIIAGSDSSGGAGIQADIKTVTALGSYAMTAITAVTTQNTTGVKSIIGINPKEIFNQIIYSCKDIRPDAIKIGMLHSSEVIRMVLKALNEIKNTVVDIAIKGFCIVFASLIRTSNSESKLLIILQFKPLFNIGVAASAGFKLGKFQILYISLLCA